jgi:hypothetical protein
VTNVSWGLFLLTCIFFFYFYFELARINTNIKSNINWPISYPSLIFHSNFCILSLPYLVQEVMHRLIKHVNVNKKHRVCTFFSSFYWCKNFEITRTIKKKGKNVHTLCFLLTLTCFISLCRIEKHFFHNVVAIEIVRCTRLIIRLCISKYKCLLLLPLLGLRLV